MEMSFTLIAFLFLKLPLILCSETESRCFWRTKLDGDDDGDLRGDCGIALQTFQGPDEENLYKDKLNIHLPSRKYQFLLVLLFAIEEINRDPNLLPNTTLEFSFIGSECNFRFDLLTETSFLINTSTFANYDCGLQRCDIVLTGPAWATSAKVASFLEGPKIHFGLFHPNLRDRDQFPHVYQTAPKDTCLATAMVSLMLHLSWTWVGLVISDNDQGIQFLSDLREEMQSCVVCLAFVNVIPNNMELYIKRAEIYYNQIMTSSANVIIIHGEMNSTLEVSFRTWESSGTQRVWVTTSQWDVIIRQRDFTLDSFQGTFIFSHHHDDIPGFNKFMQMFNTSKYPMDISLGRLEWKFFNCSFCKPNFRILNNCSSNDLLGCLEGHSSDMALSEESYNLYNAVYAAAHMYHAIVLQELENPPKELAEGIIFDCKQVFALLKKVQFTNPVGELIILSQEEKPCSAYDILSVWNFPQGLGLKMKIGQFSPYFPHGQQLDMSEDMMELATERRQVPPSVCSVTCRPGFRKFHQEGKPVCCYECFQCPENEISNTTDAEECVQCQDDHYTNMEQTQCLQRAVSFLAYEDPLGMALACMALGFSSLTALVLGVFLKHRDTPIVKANNRTLSYILLISLTFCFLCSLLFIGHPNTATCILQQITFGVVFSVAVSTVLAKTVTVILAFNLITPGRRMRMRLLSGTPNIIIPTCTLTQLILCGFWLGTFPPFIDKDVHSEHGHIIIFCNKGSVTAFYCVLCYLGSLALGSFTVAFLARNLPDTFNEAKFLTFSMLVFCSVWLTFLPVYHSTKGKVMVAVEVFSILTSSAGLLGCIFIPKCYIILIRPDRNSLEELRDKTYF